MKVGVDFLIRGCRLNEKLAIYIHVYSRFSNLLLNYSFKGILENIMIFTEHLSTASCK